MKKLLLLGVLSVGLLFGGVPVVQAGVCDDNYNAAFAGCGDDEGCQTAASQEYATCTGNEFVGNGDPEPSTGGTGSGPGGSGSQVNSGKLKLVPTKLGAAAGYDTSGTPITIIVARIIRSFLGLAGIVVVVLMCYAGFQWMTASGNEEKVAVAKRIIIQTTIGLALILMAFAISEFVIRATLQGTTGVDQTEIE